LKDEIRYKVNTLKENKYERRSEVLLGPDNNIEFLKHFMNIILNILNRSSRRKKGMASNPLFIIPDFFLHFPNELCYGYLRFEGNGKIPLGR
jgi:hypothetical protein